MSNFTSKGYMSDEHNDLSISTHLLQACQYLEWVSTHRCLLLDLSRLSRKFDYYIQNLPSQHHQSEWKWYSALKKISAKAWRLCINRDAKESKMHHRINLPVPVDWRDDFSKMDSNPKTKKILCFMIFMLTVAKGFAWYTYMATNFVSRWVTHQFRM